MPKYNVRSSNTGIIISDVGAFPLQTEVCEYKYPFDRSIHQSQTLFYIQTGKAASNELKICLLDIRHTDEERHKNFVRECLDNPTRFEEPIKRMKVVDIQAGRYQQSTIYKQEYSGTQIFTRSDGSIADSCHQATSRP